MMELLSDFLPTTSKDKNIGNLWPANVETDFFLFDPPHLDTNFFINAKDEEEECFASPVCVQDQSKEIQRKARQREAVKRHRKRKIEEMHQLKKDAQRLAEEKELLEKKLKLTHYIETKKSRQHMDELTETDEKKLMREMDSVEELLRKRKATLQRILEAWNIGGIDDMEEIAHEVYDKNATLLNPDYSEELKGVKAIMSHWGILIDAFPDGMMEEYNIRLEDSVGEKMRVDWVFSGTQVNPFNGIPARRSYASIKGSSFVTFKGEKICKIVISWNYREAMMKLLGISPANIKTEESVVLCAQAVSSPTPSSL